MTEEVREPDEPEEAPTGVQAHVRHGWWPGWIWSIPIAALIVVSWLGARALLTGGTNITIVFADVHGIEAHNTGVTFRGMRIGRVTGLELNSRGSAVTVTASIDASAKQLLRSGTRFYLEGATPSLSHLASLKAVLSGPTIVMLPGPGRRTSHFRGLERKPIAPSASARPLLYEISLTGVAGALERGDPVKYRGFTVGEVMGVGFYYDPVSGKISTPGTLAIYPSLFHVKGQRTAPTARAVSAELERLVREGLRARLARNPPLLGRYAITLERQPMSSGPAVLATVDGLPQIPMAAGGGLAAVLERIEKVPIRQIARNALDITRHVEALTASPHLKDAIVQLDAALRQMHHVTGEAAPQVGPILVKLRQAASDLDHTTASADRMLNGTATQSGLRAAVRQITQAAHAIRSLADYLDRNPSALLRGRRGGSR